MNQSSYFPFVLIVGFLVGVGAYFVIVASLHDYSCVLSETDNGNTGIANYADIHQCKTHCDKWNGTLETVSDSMSICSFSLKNMAGE